MKADDQDSKETCIRCGGVVPVVIPSYEPEKCLLKLCSQLYENGIRDVIIIDDGSGEDYRDIFNQIEKTYNYIILRNAVNLGKGRALKHAFNYALNTYPNLIGVITADSDGQHSADDIQDCKNTLLRNPDSFILGCRNFDRKSVPWKSRVGNNFTKLVFKYLCGLKISDTQTGLRAIPKEFMKALLTTPGEKFEYETNMILEGKDKVNMIEIPIETIYDSKENHHTHFDPLKDSMMIYRIIISYSLAAFFSAIVDFTLFAITNNLGTSIWFSTGFARTISSGINFYFNRNKVFKSNGNVAVQFMKYILLVICSGTASAFLITRLLEVFSIQVLIIKGVVEVFLFFLNYYVQSSLIFVSRKREAV